MSEHIYESAIREQLAQHSGDSKQQLQRFSSQLFDSISQGLLRDGHVRIHQFGSFKLNWAKQRHGRNPRTGEPLIIPAQPRVIFTPAKALKEKVNQPQMEATRHPVNTPHASSDSARLDKAKTPSSKPSVQTVNPDSQQQLADTIQNNNPSSVESQPFQFNRNMALAASIVVAILAGLILWPASHERPIASHTMTPTDKPMIEPDQPALLAQAGSVNLMADRQPKINEKEFDNTDAWSQQQVSEPTQSVLNHDASDILPSNSEPVFFQQQSHKLVNGDSLWRLSRKHYFNPFYWPYIYQANSQRIDNPNKLVMGQIIELPSLYGSPENLTAKDRRNIAEGYFRVYQYYKKTDKAFPYYALLGAHKFDPKVIQDHISEIDEQDWHSLQLASN